MPPTVQRWGGGGQRMHTVRRRAVVLTLASCSLLLNSFHKQFLFIPGPIDQSGRSSAAQTRCSPPPGSETHRYQRSHLAHWRKQLMLLYLHAPVTGQLYIHVSSLE